MVKNKALKESAYISELAIFGIQEKKGNDIVRLDLRNIFSSVSDYFVICHADSSTQVKAIANSVEEEIFKATQQEPWRKEGLEYGEWILLDAETWAGPDGAAVAFARLADLYGAFGRASQSVLLEPR